MSPDSLLDPRGTGWGLGTRLVGPLQQDFNLEWPNQEKGRKSILVGSSNHLRSKVLQSADSIMALAFHSAVAKITKTTVCKSGDDGVWKQSIC